MIKKYVCLGAGDGSAGQLSYQQGHGPLDRSTQPNKASSAKHVEKYAPQPSNHQHPLQTSQEPPLDSQPNEGQFTAGDNLNTKPGVTPTAGTNTSFF